MDTIAKSVEELVTVSELVERARTQLTSELFDYIEGGSSGEQTLRASLDAFERWRFAPRMLVGAGRVRLETELFGRRMRAPIFAAPFGYDQAIHPEGHAAVARACTDLGLLHGVPEASSTPAEAIAEAGGSSPAGRMLQLGLAGDESHILDFADRAAQAGYSGLLFIDAPARAWRERMRRGRLGLPERFGRGNYGPGLADPAVLDGLHDPDRVRWSFERLERLAPRLPLPWVLKGVLSADEAKRAVNAGAAGVYVSTVGGRDLDGLPPSLHCLPQVASAVNGAVPILFDSGVRRGTDIVKALALGASMVGVGRLPAFGLAAGGYEGVRRMFELLIAETTVVFEHLGRTNPAELHTEELIGVG